MTERDHCTDEVPVPQSGAFRRLDAVAPTSRPSLAVVLRELLLVGTMLLGYRAARLITANDGALALQNARRLWDWQHSVLGPVNEQHWQQLALAVPGAPRAANLYYAWVHFPVTAAVLLFLLMGGHRGLYGRTRTALAISTALGLALHLAYPLAPPRMLPGFVDTARAYGPSVYSSDPGGLVNQFAAMPSLHVGWAVVVALALRRLPGRRLGATASIHLWLTVLVVVVTANHYWSDVVAGAAVATLGWMLAAAVSTRGMSSPLRRFAAGVRSVASSPLQVIAPPGVSPTPARATPAPPHDPGARDE